MKVAESLILPSTINGSLSLSGLKSAEGLKLPSTIKLSNVIMDFEVKKQYIKSLTIKQLQILLKQKLEKDLKNIIEKIIILKQIID